MVEQIFLSPQVKRSVVIALRVAERLKTSVPKELGNIKKISKLHRIIDQCSILLLK